jgi:very-short-patch-repair endonuclease
MTSPDVRIARLAERQHGVFSRAQALGAGSSPRSIEGRLASARWQVVHRGVYRIAGAPLVFEGRALAAVLAVGHCALASHGTAAVLLKLESCIADESFHVSVADRRRIYVAGVKVHVPRTLRPQDRTQIGVIPITTAARTLLDISGSLAPVTLELVLDDAIRRGLINPKRLLSHLRARPNNGRCGVVRLTSLLEERVARPATGSGQETRFARLLRRAGLPDPMMQYEIRDQDGAFVARVDFAYPHVRLAIEIDGYAHHSGRQQFEHDRRRQNRIVQLGWTPLRFSPRSLAERPTEVVATITRALASGLVSSNHRYGGQASPKPSAR